MNPEIQAAIAAAARVNGDFVVPEARAAALRASIHLPTDAAPRRAPAVDLAPRRQPRPEAEPHPLASVEPEVDNAGAVSLDTQIEPPPTIDPSGPGPGRAVRAAFEYAKKVAGFGAEDREAVRAQHAIAAQTKPVDLLAPVLNPRPERGLPPTTAAKVKGSHRDLKSVRDASTEARAARDAAQVALTAARDRLQAARDTAADAQSAHAAAIAAEAESIRRGDAVDPRQVGAARDRLEATARAVEVLAGVEAERRAPLEAAEKVLEQCRAEEHAAAETVAVLELLAAARPAVDRFISEVAPHLAEVERFSPRRAAKVREQLLQSLLPVIDLNAQRAAVQVRHIAIDEDKRVEITWNKD